jgi:hypothetical protein
VPRVSWPKHAGASSFDSGQFANGASEGQAPCLDKNGKTQGMSASMESPRLLR